MTNYNKAHLYSSLNQSDGEKDNEFGSTFQKHLREESLVKYHAIVGTDSGSSDPTTIRTCQECHNICDIGRLSDPNSLSGRLLCFLGETSEHICGNGTRIDAVDTDIFVTEFSLTGLMHQKQKAYNELKLTARTRVTPSAPALEAAYAGEEKF